jgi:hypothetical protein
VNDLIIDAWTNKSASDLTATIDLQGGIRYNLKMEITTRGRLRGAFRGTAPAIKQVIRPAAFTRSVSRKPRRRSSVR